MADKYFAKMRATVPVFDGRLSQSRYVVGDSVTAADMFLAPIVFNFPATPGLKEIGEASPKLAHWMRDMSAQPSKQATVPEPIAARAA